MGQLTAPTTTILIGTPVIGGTVGSVLFVGAGGLVAQDNANLFFDDVNNQLLLGDGSTTNPAYSFSSGSGTGIWKTGGALAFSTTGVLRAYIDASDFNIMGSVLSWSSPIDLSLVRDAANTLAQRNGVNVQTNRIYRTFTTAADFERLSLITSTTGGRAGLFFENAGTGVARTLAFGVAAESWGIEPTNNNFVGLTDNTHDIGATGATRPRSIFIGTSIQIEANNGLKLTTQTNGAAAQVGTLNNSPVAGNPAFWLPVTVNGNNRHIPCW
jgi:hypothetical protein